MTVANPQPSADEIPADRPQRAAALLVFALALLGLQDAIVKIVSSDTSIWQFQWIRAVFNLVLLFVVVSYRGQLRDLIPKRSWAVALRSGFLVAAMLCFFSGVPFLTLSEIAAGLYLFPLFVTLLSASVLGEKVGPQRFLAVGVGLIGSLLILKPGTANFQLVSLMPVGAAFFYASTILCTRKLCRAESPYTLALGTALMFLLVGSIGIAAMPAARDGGLPDWPYLLTGWHAVALLTVGLIAACSLLNLTANIALSRAYQTAESSWLAPYDYSYLIFATFWGFVFWGTIPDVATFLGMGLIAAAGIFVAWRERVRDGAAPTPATR